MNLFVFQFVIKQWDKSQNTLDHQAKRSALPERYNISNKPTYQVLGKSCVLEQYGDDLPTNIFKEGRIKTAVLPDNYIRLDRFMVTIDPKGDRLEYWINGKIEKTIGLLNQGWIQSRYRWRYSVIEGGQIYWMYEEVILNAVCLDEDEFEQNVFLKTEPRIIFEVER
ncbi:MAG: hypothetical protein ACI8O8_000662 [Oleiphilaceae bacterium]|jgi:hypothetical protein